MKYGYLSIAAVLLAVPNAFADSAYTCTTFFVHDSGPYSNTHPTGINNKGQVVGFWESYDQPEHAFLREADGTISPLTSPYGSEEFEPVGINNLGQIAGNPSNSSFEPFIINPDGSYIKVQAPAIYSNHPYYYWWITGINDKGELSGWIYTNGSLPGTLEAAVFIRGVDGTYRIIEQSDGLENLGVPPVATGPVNNADAVVVNTKYDSYLLVPNGSKTRLWFPGIPVDPQSTGGTSFATGLNNSNIAVGSTFSKTNYPDFFSFARTPDAHFPAIVCPQMAQADLSVGGINDQNVIAGSYGSLAVIATPTGIYPHAKLSNSSWSFASHSLGEASGLGRIYVSNFGPANLHIPAVYIGETGQSTDRAKSFQITQTNCARLRTAAPSAPSVSPSIPPGGFCSIDFRFTPEFPYWQTAAIYIASDAADSPQVIKIGGTGIGSPLRLSNTSWTFAAHPVGETSGNGAIYAYNGGSSPIRFQPEIGVTPGSDFGITGNTCGPLLTPYTTCAVTFHFIPSSPGEHTALLHFNDNSQGGPITVPLHGYGLPNAQ